MAAIFDLRHIQTSDSIPSIPTSLSVLPNPKNIGIAVGSLDMPCTIVDTCISGLSVAILNFWVTPQSHTLHVDKSHIDQTFHIGLRQQKCCYLRHQSQDQPAMYSAPNGPERRSR